MLSHLALSLVLTAAQGVQGPTQAPASALEARPTAPSPAPAAPVRVFVPAADNLQWLNFWVALGAGHFADEGLDVALVVGAGARSFVPGVADVAVLPRPAFLMQVGQGQPLVAFANLLANDPISLVVARNVAEARGISADTPVRDRLRAMSGLRVGVAPGPPSRLRFLFESVGLDADRHLEIVIVPGPEQNEALQAGRVDALYSHTPYLERALVDQDAVMVVNQSAGEVVGLAGRQIHMLVTTRDYADGHRDVLVAMARAVHRAQGLIHSDREATIAAIRASGVAVRAPSALDVFVELYEPAVPSSPEVTVAGVLRELELFPDRRPLPDLSGIDMAAHVDNQFAREAVSDGR